MTQAEENEKLFGILIVLSTLLSGLYEMPSTQWLCARHTFAEHMTALHTQCRA